MICKHCELVITFIEHRKVWVSEYGLQLCRNRSFQKHEPAGPVAAPPACFKCGSLKDNPIHGNGPIGEGFHKFEATAPKITNLAGSVRPEMPPKLSPAEWNLFHKLWTKAVGTENYDKQEWVKFENLLVQLSPTYLAVSAQQEPLREALLKLKSFNEDIAEGKINYRPEDHLFYINRALQSQPAAPRTQGRELNCSEAMEHFEGCDKCSESYLEEGASRTLAQARIQGSEPEIDTTALLILGRLRQSGWMVAIHNDYRQSGELHTFYLMANGERCIKGEGRTDAEALAEIERTLVAQPQLALPLCPNCGRDLNKPPFFTALPEAQPTPHKLDTNEQVFFYEQEFYVLSNFSAFSLYWKDLRFDTSEAAYHFEKFPGRNDIQRQIHQASSAHEAFKIAERAKASRREDWDDVKVQIMEEVLRAKVNQHEYVRRKLLQTGNRELIENSWRDDYWGWGEDRNGQNQLGKLWMKIRSSLPSPPEPTPTKKDNA